MSLSIPLSPILCPVDGRVNRLCIETRLSLPGTSTPIRSRPYFGVIDTGAQRTLIPLEVVEWFENQAGHLLVRGPLLSLIVADGHAYDAVTGYFLHLHFTVRADPSRRVRAMTFETSSHGRDHAAPLCYALPTPKAGRGRHRHQPSILIGMDILRDWRVLLDGPNDDFRIAIP